MPATKKTRILAYPLNFLVYVNVTMSDDRESWSDTEWIAQAMIEQEDFGRMRYTTRRKIEQIHKNNIVRSLVVDMLDAAAEESEKLCGDTRPIASGFPSGSTVSCNKPYGHFDPYLVHESPHGGSVWSEKEKSIVRFSWGNADADEWGLAWHQW